MARNAVNWIELMKKRLLLFLVLVFLGSSLLPKSAHADGIPLIARGIGRTLFSVLQLPKDMIQNGGQAFPLGLVTGAISGTMKAVAGTLVGAVDIARGAAPYAKYAAIAMV